MNKGHTRGNTTTAVLVVILLVVVVIGVVALFTNQNRDQAPVAMATSTDTVASTTEITPTSTTASASVPSPSRPIVNVYIQPVAPTSQTASVEMSQQQQPRFALCTANDLTGMAHWQGGTGSIIGVLTITDSSRSPCSLSHDDYLQIMSSNQVLPVAQIANGSAGAETDLYPGQSVQLDFRWANWCGSGPLDAAYVRLILPANGGYLRVPLIDQNGEPQSDTPRCDASGSYSYVSIWQ